LTGNQSYVAAGNCGSLLGLPGDRNGGPSSFNRGLKRSELLDDVSRFSTQQITRLASKPTLLPDDAILALSNTTGNHFNPLGAQFPDPLQIMLSKELFRPSQLPAVAAEAISEVSRTKNNRDTPLRDNWESILMPLVEFLKLQVRFNTRTRSVELKTSPHTTNASSLQKGADFVSAFLLGFEVQDAVALLRLDDLFVESFQVPDVKMLKGDHLSRAGIKLST
jgi:hypothetical protein